MSKQLPKKLFVKVEKDSNAEYFVADEDANTLVEMGEKVTIGTYQLVEVASAEGVAQFGKARR